MTHRNPDYAAMVHSLDENVGRVLDTLADLDLADETIVFLTSDNGGVIGVTSNSPPRAGKGFLYEGGVREPLIVRWPGRIDPGSTSDALVTTPDFYPTIVDVVRSRDQSVTAPAGDGVSFLPVLAGGTAPPDRAIFWHYPHYHTPQRPPSGAVRSGRFKLIEFYEDDRIELYDLAADPGETSDLAGRMPEQAAALRRLLHDWRLAVDAQMPEPNPAYEPQNPFKDGYTAWGARSPQP